MISEEQLKENKERYISLLRSITREGANVEALIYKLENSDFFTAPASTMFHLAEKGGLCKHCLNVRDNLFKLVEMKGIDSWSDDTLNIVSLCHDFAKLDFYETYFKNVKFYSEVGSKKDEMGKFDWRTEQAYKVKESTERLLYGTHGQNSEYVTGRYIPLSIEESSAIINHMGNEQTSSPDLTAIYNRFSLATLLHAADFISTYIDERIYSVYNV